MFGRIATPAQGLDVENGVRAAPTDQKTVQNLLAIPYNHRPAGGVLP